MLHVPSELRTFPNIHHLKITAFKFIVDFSKKSCALRLYTVITYSYIIHKFE